MATPAMMDIFDVELPPEPFEEEVLVEPPELAPVKGVVGELAPLVAVPNCSPGLAFRG